jgi:hypothetical protein
MTRTTKLLLGLICVLLNAQPIDRRANLESASAYIVLSMPARARTSSDSPSPWLSEGSERCSGENATVGDTGEKVDVRVVDEAGIGRVGAKVYHNGVLIGVTDDAGILSIDRVRTGDQLAALYPVYERPTPKGRHALGGSTDWAWRIYQSSVTVTPDGTARQHEVRDNSVIQELVVRRVQPLVGFHMVVCIEWDAGFDYIADLRQGLEEASSLLYDVSDGQFFWEVIEILDNCSDLSDCDVHILASNQQWPRGHVGGIIKGQSQHITMGRHFSGGGSSRDSWANPSAYRALVHEFGHYGLGLWDEYPKARGGGAAPNPSDVYPAEANTCESIMNDPYGATGLCSRADPNFEEGLRTQHAAKTQSELTWETVLRRLSDRASPRRWILQSPVERGRVLPGPKDIPVADWMQVHITDQDGEVCPDFKIRVIDEGTGVPMGDAEVQVNLSSSTRPDLYQGRTDASGQILIYGAHAGDEIRASKSSTTAAIVIDCSETRVWSRTARAEWEP